MHDSKRIKISDNLYITTSTSDNAKELINKKPSVYENYIMNEHDKKINMFNKFLKIFNKNNPNSKLLPFYNSLDNTELHLVIKYIIVKYYQIKPENMTKKIMKDILNNDLTDFTINFPDGTSFKCLKVLLKTINYFSMIFNDFKELHNCIDLNVNHVIATIVLNLLYEQNVTQSVTVENFIEIIKLMDMWLMNTCYLKNLLPFIENNIEQITKFLSENEKFNDILILVKYLEKSRKMKHIVKIIFKYDFKDKIFMFDSWPLNFNDEQKIQAIRSSGKFELLNVAQIDPHKVIDFLSEFNDVSILETISIMKYSDGPVYFKQVPNSKPDGQIEMMAIIDEYYPHFKVTLFTKSDIKRCENNSYNYHKTNNVFSHTHPLKDISINTHILIGDNIKLIYNDPSHEYYYTCFTKNINDKTIKCQKLSFKMFHKYILEANKNIDKIGHIWTINKFEYKFIDMI
jgi:hypothetical protein